MSIVKEKALRGVPIDKPGYLILSPIGKVLHKGGVLDVAEGRSKIKNVKGSLVLVSKAGEESDLEPPKPFEMFGVRFERGIAWTEDEALAQRITSEFPAYIYEEA